MAESGPDVVQFGLNFGNFSPVWWGLPVTLYYFMVKLLHYPFDSNQEGREVYSPSPDDAVFKSLAMAFSHAHKKMHLGQPCPGERESFRDGITNGAQWYTLNGGMQDWNYLHTNDFEITLGSTTPSKFVR